MGRAPLDRLVTPSGSTRPLTPAWSRDTFAAGAVRPRRGGLAELVFEDLNGNGDPELIVVVRSAGSGGYLSADAFFVGRRGRLTFAGHVDDLPPTAGPRQSPPASPRSPKP